MSTDSSFLTGKINRLPIAADSSSSSLLEPAARKGRVLLITPNLKCPNDGKSSPRIQPPLGPMIAGSFIRQQGHEVYFHDCALSDFDRHTVLDARTVLVGQTDEAIARTITKYQPDIIGISALFSNLMGSAHDIARIAKEASPRTTVILGGNHIGNAVKDYRYARSHPDSGLPARLYDMEDTNIDLAMHGEVDIEFPRLVDYLLHKKDISVIPGLVMRKNGTGSEPGENLEYLINGEPAAIEPYSTLPHPARDLVDMEGYFKIGAFHSPKSKSKRIVNVMASRGCPEVCTFCSTPDTWGAKVRWRDTEDIIREITDAKNDYNVEEIQFEDDTITAVKPKLMELCAALEKVGLPWCTPNGTKTNYHSKYQLEMYKAMAGSGCYQITLACESGVQRVLDDIIRKKLRVEEMKPAIDKAKEAGMLVHTFWILGYPGETYEEMQQTIKVAEECGADSYSFAILNPLPGTPIYRDVMRENLWWPGRGLSDLMYRNSLIKVDGFSNPEEFEAFVNKTSIYMNSLLAKRDPERFRRNYGISVGADGNVDPSKMIRQI